MLVGSTHQRISKLQGKQKFTILSFLLSLLVLSARLDAQTFPVPGTLTSTVVDHHTVRCDIDTYLYSWTFVDTNGNSHYFPTGSFQQTVGSDAFACQDLAQDPPTVDSWSTDGYYELEATADGGSIIGIGGSVDPKFKVETILYATPGNFSSDSLTNTQTTGTTTSIENDFSVGTTETFSVGFLGIDSFSVQYGDTLTTGHSNAFTETIADASSIGNASSTSGLNTLSHAQDLFVLWLNPEVTIHQTGQYDVSYSLATQSQSGTSEIVDDVEVTAQVLQNIGGSTHVPAALLNKQYDSATGNNDLPGLAGLCAGVILSEYNAGTCTLTDQCGCVPLDFAPILANDPLVNLDVATNPLSVDTSGASTCGSPSSSDSCRYVPVPSTSGGMVQQDTLLSGPNYAGGNRPVNSYSQTDSTQTTTSFVESNAESVGYSLKVGTPGSGDSPISVSLTSATTFTWTDKESLGSISGQSTQIAYSLSSGTTGCYQDVLIYEDTVFHTFVTRLAPGNTSCP